MHCLLVRTEVVPHHIEFCRRHDIQGPPCPEGNSACLRRFSYCWVQQSRGPCEERKPPTLESLSSGGIDETYGQGVCTNCYRLAESWPKGPFHRRKPQRHPRAAFGKGLRFGFFNLKIGVIAFAPRLAGLEFETFCLESPPDRGPRDFLKPGLLFQVLL